MKKTFLIPLFMLMLSAASFSQNNPVCQPDTMLIYTDRSIVEFDSMFLFNAYDPQGLFIQCREHYGDEFTKGESEQNIPPIQSKTDYEYDLNHNIVKMTELSYSIPRPDMMTSYYSYQDGKLSIYTRRVTDFYGDSHLRDSVTYKYDALDRIVEEVAYNGITESLVYSKHTVYEYDANEVVATSEGLKFDYWGDWVQLSKTTKSFSEEGRLITVVTESYDNPTKSDTYSYDVDGRVTSILTRTLDETDWTNTKLLEYSYDLDGHLILASIKTWQNGTFVYANRAVYELNDDGYPTIVTFEKWNGSDWVEGTWQKGFYVFSEDYLGRQNKFVCIRYAKRIEIHYATTSMPDYEVDERQADIPVCNIHPNPTTGQVTVLCEGLRSAELFSTLGQHLTTTSGEGDSLTLDISGLPPGIYFLSVTDSEGRKCVRKIVKE